MPQAAATPSARFCLVGFRSCCGRRELVGPRPWLVSSALAGEQLAGMTKQEKTDGFVQRQWRRDVMRQSNERTIYTRGRVVLATCPGKDKRSCAHQRLV